MSNAWFGDHREDDDTLLTACVIDNETWPCPVVRSWELRQRAEHSPHVLKRAAEIVRGDIIANLHLMVFHNDVYGELEQKCIIGVEGGWGLQVPGDLAIDVYRTERSELLERSWAASDMYSGRE